MDHRTRRYLQFFVLLCIGAVSAYAGEPWITVTPLGRTPPVGSPAELRSIVFAELPTRVLVEIGVTRSAASANSDCSDGLIIDERWYGSLVWRWTRLDGEKIEPPVGTPEIEPTVVGSPIRIEPGSRARVIVVFPTPPVGRYRVSATAKVSECSGTIELSGTSDVVEVFNGNESGWVARQYLMAKKERAASFEEYVSIMEEVARVDPDDTGVWKDLAVAFAERGDIVSTIKYHQLFVVRTKEKMNKKYGSLPNWPAAAQKSWSQVEARNQNLQAVAQDKTLQIGLGPDRNFVVISRESKKVLRVIE